MSIFKKLSYLILLVSPLTMANTGPYIAKIERIQVTDIGNPYNTVFLELDVTDSPCPSTNQHDRFEVSNEAQYSAILAALMADREVRISGSGNCNSGGNETIRNVQLWRQ